MKTQDRVEMSVFFDNNICPTISASGVSLSVIMLVPSHAEFFEKKFSTVHYDTILV